MFVINIIITIYIIVIIITMIIIIIISVLSVICIFKKKRRKFNTAVSNALHMKHKYGLLYL